MSISPTGRPPSPPERAVRSGPSRRTRESDDDRAARAQRDAQAKIDASEKQVEEAQRETDAEVDRVRGQGDERLMLESSREEQTLENQKTKGYAALRDLQRRQQKELDRVRREGDRQLSQTTDYYRDALYSGEKQGREKLDGLHLNQARELEYENRSHELTLEDQTRSHAMAEDGQRALHQRRMDDLIKANRAEFEQKRAATSEARAQEDEQFHQRFETQRRAHDETLADLDAVASQEIRHIRRDTADKLEAYRKRQHDPFYRMVDLDASLEETRDGFRLTVRVPEHEQGHMSVTVRGNELVVSGYRRNEEKLKLEDGGSQTTAAFQSFSKSFPLSYPVVARDLRKSFDGDEMIITVPKAPEYAQRPQPPAPKPERARVERPRFPENLPLANKPDAGTDDVVPENGAHLGDTRGRRDRPLS